MRLLASLLCVVIACLAGFGAGLRIGQPAYDESFVSDEKPLRILHDWKSELPADVTNVDVRSMSGGVGLDVKGPIRFLNISAVSTIEGANFRTPYALRWTSRASAPRDFQIVAYQDDKYLENITFKADKGIASHSLAIFPKYETHSLKIRVVTPAAIGQLELKDFSIEPYDGILPLKANDNKSDASRVILSSWELLPGPTTKYSLERSERPMGIRFRVQGTKANEPWATRLVKRIPELKEKESIVISFDARAKAPRKLKVLLDRRTVSEQIAGKEFDVGTDWKTCSFSFVVPKEFNDAQFAFWLAGSEEWIEIANLQATLQPSTSSR